MKSADFRDATFAELQPRLSGLRKAVWHAWINHGPGTTREVATRSAIDILTFRPRSTELLQMGAITIDDARDDAPKGEGIYRARGLIEWELWWNGRLATGQLQMI